MWGLINNAGVLGPMAPIEWLTLKDYVDVFNVNCLGCIDVTQVFLPLVTKEKGRIINMSSSSGRNSLVRISAYAVSKYGIEAFSDSLRYIHNIIDPIRLHSVLCMNFILTSLVHCSV